MEETISLQDIFKVLKKHFKLIALGTIIAGLASAIISFFVLTPVYQATTQVLVNQKMDETRQQMSTMDIQTNLQLINTYNEIIKSQAILSIVIENLDLNLAPSGLASKITISNANDSQVLNVSVQDENYNLAVDLANEVVNVFKEEVPNLMNVDNVNVLSPAIAVENPSPIKPNKMVNIAIALVLGLMFGVGLAFLLEYLDTTVKTEKDIEELIGLPIIGLVSPINEDLLNSNQIVERRGNKVVNKR